MSRSFKGLVLMSGSLSSEVDSMESRQAPCCSQADSPALDSGYWQNRYDQGQTGWDRGEPSPALQYWLESGQLQPCRILVPGCGRGHEVIALAAAGFEVTAIDFAPAAIAALRTQLEGRELDASLIQADLFDYRPDQSFDAIYEQTCLCAIQPNQRVAYEARLADWLQPGGKLYALFMQTESNSGPPFACPPAAMQGLFPADRWRWPAALEPIAHPAQLVELAGVLERV